MTTLLLVEDDPAQREALARAIAQRERKFTVLTAASCAEAIDQLGRLTVDVVLTDLQMPGATGFELLAWMMTNSPGVPVLVMTAYFDANAGGKLKELGAVEYFTKPLDVAALVRRLSDVSTQVVRGQIQNIGLASFLQLIEMERKTCTLEVRDGGKVGYLYLRRGELVDATLDSIRGEDAALRIAAWISPGITIIADGSPRPTTVTRPLSFLVMEALRLSDEAEFQQQTNAESPKPPGLTPALTPRASFPAFNLQARRSSVPPAPRASTSGQFRLSSIPPKVEMTMSDGVLGFALAEVTGAIVHAEPSQSEGLAAVTTFAALLLRGHESNLERLHSEQTLEEIWFSTDEFGALIRPLPGTRRFVLLAFDPERANPALKRLELHAFVRELSASGLLSTPAR